MKLCGCKYMCNFLVSQFFGELFLNTLGARWHYRNEGLNTKAAVSIIYNRMVITSPCLSSSFILSSFLSGVILSFVPTW